VGQTTQLRHYGSAGSQVAGFSKSGGGGLSKELEGERPRSSSVIRELLKERAPFARERQKKRRTKNFGTEKSADKRKRQRGERKEGQGLKGSGCEPPQKGGKHGA